MSSDMPSRSHADASAGIFTVPDVALLAGVPAQQVRRWFVDTPARDPLFSVERLDGESVLTFHDLVTALLVRSFRDSGVSMQLIRRCASVAAKELGTERPFASRRFYTDGRTILLDIGQRSGEPGAELLDLATRQGVFRKVIAPFLSNVEYDIDESAVRWWPQGRRARVVVDPERAFGAPVLARSGIPTRVLAGPYRSGDTAAKIASWYDIPRAEVLAAVRFEAKLHAAA